MDHKLKAMTGALGALAREPETNTNRVPLAETRIKEFIHQLADAGRRSALKDIRDAAATKAGQAATGAERNFWQDIEAFIQQQLGL